MSYALHKVYEFVESITREGNFVEFWKSTSKDASGPKEHARPEIGPQKKRLELRNTLDPKLDLQHAAFMSYTLDKVYEIVGSITREGNFVEEDLRNTLDSELDL